MTKKNMMINHLTKDYVLAINELLHYAWWSTYYYKFEIYEVPELFTLVFITYDDQEEDEFVIIENATFEMVNDKFKALNHELEDIEESFFIELAKQPQKTMVSWVKRSLSFLKGGQNEQYWTPGSAKEDLFVAMSGVQQFVGPLILEEMKNLHETLPKGVEHFTEYEHMVRITFNYLFTPPLGEGKHQVRTVPGDDGLEIRDIIAQNRSDDGFWKDIKDRFKADEIVIDAKNKGQITRDDLRQLYCYLKEGLSLWGIIVSRNPSSTNIVAYNRTLFKNFSKQRGVLLLSDRQLKQMVEMKIRQREPTDYIRNLWSKFIRTI